MDRLILLSVVGISLRRVLDLVFLQDFKYVMVPKVQCFVHGSVIPLDPLHNQKSSSFHRKCALGCALQRPADEDY